MAKGYTTTQIDDDTKALIEALQARMAQRTYGAAGSVVVNTKPTKAAVMRAAVERLRDLMDAEDFGAQKAAATSEEKKR